MNSTSKPQTATPTVATTARRKALASVKRGILDTPVRVLIYGAEKVGKSTFAAGAPSPIFLGAENGTERLDVERLQPTSWQEALDWIGELATEPHDYKTLVIDPLNWLEPMCWARVVRDTGGTIEEYGGGFMKGYAAAIDHWREMLFGVERCWQRGMHVILAAHTQVKNFKNPEGPSYDRYEIAMHQGTAGLFKQWADAVLFVQMETFTSIDKKTKRTLASTSGARIVHTAPSAAYDAGARWKLPETLPLSWDDFYGAVRAEGARAGELAVQAASIATALADPEVTKFVEGYVAKNKANADKLAELVNRLSLKLEQSKKETA